MSEANSRGRRLANIVPAALCLGLAAGLACSHGGGAKSEGGAPAPDRMRLFFRNAEVPSPAPQELARFPEAVPGDSQRLGRSFPDAPPQIPHDVEDLLPITLGANDCLDCHLPSNAGPDDVPLPETHFRRPLMGAPDRGPMAWVVRGYEQKEELAGTRYICVTCHTPQSSNARTVESTFTPIAGAATQ